MLDRKLAIEKRKERSRRLCVRGSFIERVVPELIGMTGEEAKAFLRIILTREEARAFPCKKGLKMLTLYKERTPTG